PVCSGSTIPPWLHGRGALWFLPTPTKEPLMRRLRPTDGTAVHRRAARYHIAKCRTASAPLHGQLKAEMAALYDDLKAKARATEDAEDTLVEANADVDSTEIAFENVIRDLDAELDRLDRDDPSLAAQRAVFPEGFGQVIDPEGDGQL